MPPKRKSRAKAAGDKVQFTAEGDMVAQSSLGRYSAGIEFARLWKKTLSIRIQKDGVLRTETLILGAWRERACPPSGNRDLTNGRTGRTKPQKIPA